MKYMRKSPRVELLDEFRGIVILYMVFYHAFYDIVYIFGADMAFYHWPAIKIGQLITCSTFIFLAGITCRYSHNNIKRGFTALGLGVAISLVTYFILPEQMIWFGVLHFLGTCMILFALIHPFLDRFSVVAGIAICAVLFLFTVRLPYGSVGFPGLFAINLPRGLYSVRYLLPLGFGGSGSDYFPLFPWMFLFFAGAFLGVAFHQNDMPRFFYRSHCRPLGVVGKHSILIYVLHQPLLYGVLWVVFYFIRR